MKQFLPARIAKSARVAISSTFALCFVIVSPRVCKAYSQGIPEGAEDWEWIQELIQGKSLTIPESENWYAYYKKLLIGSAGVGIGIAFIVGLLMTLFTIAFYCRGKKRSKTSEHLTKGRGCQETKKLVTDLEDKARRERRNLWIGLLACLAGYSVAAGLAYRSITGSEKTFTRSLDGTHEFLTNFQLSL